MRLVVKILLAATAVAMTACRDLPDYLVSDNTVAKVGRKELKINEIMEAMPANVKGIMVSSPGRSARPCFIIVRFS